MQSATSVDVRPTWVGSNCQETALPNFRLPVAPANVGLTTCDRHQPDRAGRARAWAPALALGAALILAGCAATTPTRETMNGYAIFEIRAAPGVTHARLTDAVRVALQKNTSQVQIHQGIPPAKLPETPQRFQLMSPFKGSGLAAVAAASGQALEVPTCDGAIVTATARDTSMGRYGEATSFFVCVLAHQGGWTLNIHTRFSKASGAFNAATLGATLARTVVGDSSQFIMRTIDALVDGIKATGAPVTLTESYP